MPTQLRRGPQLGRGTSLVIASHDTVGGTTRRRGPHVWPPAHLLSIDVAVQGERDAWISSYGDSCRHS